MNTQPAQMLARNEDVGHLRYVMVCGKLAIRCACIARHQQRNHFLPNVCVDSPLSGKCIKWMSFWPC